MGEHILGMVLAVIVALIIWSAHCRASIRNKDQK